MARQITKRWLKEVIMDAVNHIVDYEELPENIRVNRNFDITFDWSYDLEDCVEIRLVEITGDCRFTDYTVDSIEVYTDGKFDEDYPLSKFIDNIYEQIY